MNIIITIASNNPPCRLAEAELHFTDGPLVGLKLIGFGIWERRTGSERNVTFPARTYSVNGERRSFSLVRPIGYAPDVTEGNQERLRDAILAAYDAHVATVTPAVDAGIVEADRAFARSSRVED